MSYQRLKRSHLRAPLKSTCLYEDDSHVFKGHCQNISEGGILLSELPHVPEVNKLPLMIDLPRFPNFQELALTKLMTLNAKSFERDIIRANCKIVRTFEGKSDVEKIFVAHIGCQFVSRDDEATKKITAYVEIFAKNTIYLLGLFEQLTKNEQNIEVIRSVARCLGYQKDEKLSLLRQKVLHDYQSLESL